MLIGFRRVKIQPLNKDEQASGEIIVLEGKNNEGASQEATISGISPEGTKVWGSDVAYYVSQKGTGDIKVSLTLLDMPRKSEALILGYEADEALGAQFVGENTEPPYCAVTLESTDAHGNVALLGFFKGKFSKGDVSMKTKEGAAYTPNGDSYTYSAVASSKDGATKGKTMVQFFGTEEKKSEVEALVFGTGA